ncbi:hypothetical protein [Faunimonas pinastri]|nr:hypothetical protein [Faunimonas pinastri]
MAMRAIPRLVVQSAEGVKLVIHVSGRWLVDRLALDFDHPSPSRGGRPYLNVEEWKRLQKLREYFEVVSGAPEDAHMLAGASKLARDKRDVMLKLRLSSEFDAVIVTEADGFPPFLSKGQPA